DVRGNDGPWTPRKTKSRFSPGAHSPWKSRRDSHIPTVATKHWKWKTKNRFSHFPLPRVGSSDQIQKGGLAAELRSSSRLIVRLENASPIRRRVFACRYPRHSPMTFGSSLGDSLIGKAQASDYMASLFRSWTVPIR